MAASDVDPLVFTRPVDDSQCKCRVGNLLLDHPRFVDRRRQTIANRIVGRRSQTFDHPGQVDWGNGWPQS